MTRSDVSFNQFIKSLGLQGTLTVPGDKSISHRSLMFSALSTTGMSEVKGLLQAGDVMSTANCLRGLGVTIDCVNAQTGHYRITPSGDGFVEPSVVLDAGNSGTTIRLMTGLLAGRGLYSVFTGDASLSKRPMGRVITPLSQMGANLVARDNNRYLPLTILPVSGLKAMRYEMPIASAQVKSAVLLAGLCVKESARETTTVVEPLPSRDHTERMLQAMGVKVVQQGTVITIQPAQTFEAQQWQVPGDFSSAAFHLVAALLTPHSEVALSHVGTNPRRTGLMTALNLVGAGLTLADERVLGGEPIASVVAHFAELEGDLTITADMVPDMVDEIPILAVAGVFLKGTLTVRGAEELRKKESDRIGAMAEGLRSLGVDVEVYEDGFSLQGNPERILPIPKKPLETFHDHRIAMALTILNQVNNARNALQDTWPILNTDCINISYPTFFEDCRELQRS